MDKLRSLFVWNQRPWLCIVIGALLLANIASLVYIARTRNVNYFHNPYPLIDPARSLIAQEHFLPTIEPLRQELKQTVAKHESEGRQVSLYFEICILLIDYLIC